MSNVNQAVKTRKNSLNHKVSLALLSGALAFQSAELVRLWASSPTNSDALTYDNGNSPLHIAVQNSWVQATKILLEKGSSPHNINSEDLSVITLARNIYREYENKVILYEAGLILDHEANIKFICARQVLDILDKYKYADNI